MPHFVLQVTDSTLLKIDVMEDETALCSVLEGFDHADGEGGVGSRKGEVGGSVVDVDSG